ncbi:MAG: hypothetical protein AB8G15_14075 [Saprospiraceae bacterium]
MLFLLVACEPKQNPFTERQCASLGNTTISLVKVDSFKIEEPFEYEGPHDFYDCYNDKENKYIIQSGNNNNILFYNITTRQLEKVINPDDQQPTAEKIGSIYVHNLDSIFFTDTYLADVFLIDGTGKLLQRWTFEYDATKFSDNAPAYRLYSSYQNLFYAPPELHLAVDHGQLLDFTTAKNWKNHRIYDVDTKTFKSSFGTLPPYYTYTKNSKHLDNFLVPTKIVEPQRILISYPLSHSIQVYSKAGEFIEEKCAASTLIDLLDAPLTVKEKQQEFLRFAASPHYMNLSFHADLNIYSRLVKRKYDIQNEDGSLKSPLGIQYTMILLDTELNIIGEKPLDDYLYDWRFSLATSDGYIVSSIGEKWLGKGYLIYNDQYKIIIDQ